MTISTYTFTAVNVGTSPNDGTGDDLRSAFSKVNNNFQFIGNTGLTTANIFVTNELDATIIQVTTLGVSGVTTTAGIKNTGAQIETGYQQYKPTANIAVTANIGVNRVLLHPTGTIVSFGANITLPNTQVDGTIFSISSNVTISQLAVNTPWVSTTISPSGNASNVVSGTVSRYMYIAADFKWYKIA